MIYSYFLIAPLVIVLIMLVYTVTRNIGRTWLDHRVKLLLLDVLERKPELLRSIRELEDLLEDKLPDPTSIVRADLALTGIFLALIGAVCTAIYANIGGGRWAVGAYWGGVACVALGFILAATGLVIRYLERSPLDRNK